MVAPSFVVTVSGVRPTIVALTAEVQSRSARATAALVAGGNLIKGKAQANIAPYRYAGRLSAATTVQVHVKSQTFVSVTVGVHGRTFAPEGRTFEVGWRSSWGYQPPTDALTPWVMARGLASGEKEAKRVAFVVARAMGARGRRRPKAGGYSFGQRHWLTDAWRDMQPVVEALVVRYSGAAWVSQPRDRGGRWMASH